MGSAGRGAGGARAGGSALPARGRGQATSLAPAGPPLEATRRQYGPGAYVLWVGAVGGSFAGAAWAAGRFRAWVRSLPLPHGAPARPAAGTRVRGRGGLNVEEDGIVEIHDPHSGEGGGEGTAGDDDADQGGLEDVLLGSGRMREFDFESGGCRRLSAEELDAERGWWHSLPVVSVLAVGLGERGGETPGLFSVDVSFDGKGADERVVGFEDPEDALRLQSALRACPGATFSDCAALKLSPQEFLAEMRGDPNRVVVMRAGHVVVRPGTGPAEVANSVAQDYYFRQVLGVDAPPETRPPT